MDELRIGELTKEMVAEKLRIVGDPCVAAAGVVRRALTAALKSSPVDGTSSGRVIEDAVKGAMTALLLADQSLARGAILLLEVVHDVAQECQLDSTECMGSALHAFAEMRRYVDPSRLDDIRLGIEAHYMGAGDVFLDYLRAPLKPDSKAAPR